MGWMGWTEADTLDHTPHAIRLAKKGRVEMIDSVLKAVFGTSKDATGPLSGKHAATAENFARAFAAIERDSGP